MSRPLYQYYLLPSLVYKLFEMDGYQWRRDCQQYKNGFWFIQRIEVYTLHTLILEKKNGTQIQNSENLLLIINLSHYLLNNNLLYYVWTYQRHIQEECFHTWRATSKCKEEYRTHEATSCNDDR